MMSGPLFYGQVPLRRPQLGLQNWWELNLPEPPELPQFPEVIPPEPAIPPPAPIEEAAAEPGDGGAPAGEGAPAGNGGAPAANGGAPANGGIPAANGGIMMPQMGPSMTPAFLFQAQRQPVQKTDAELAAEAEVAKEEPSLTKDLAVTGLVALGVIAVISFAK